MPILSAELFSALLTMAAAYVAVQAGTVGLALFTALALLIFQYLVGELLKSKQRGEQLHRVATTDELTGLANRERFRAPLDQQIATAKENDESFGVMLLDLDRFKEVNDTLGHHFGDELLRDLGPRLARCDRAGGPRRPPRRRRVRGPSRGDDERHRGARGDRAAADPRVCTSRWWSTR